MKDSELHNLADKGAPKMLRGWAVERSPSRSSSLQTFVSQTQTAELQSCKRVTE